MNKKLRTIMVLSLVLVLSAPSVSCGRDVFDTTLKGSVYGGAVGALIGAALMIFTDKPADHWNYVAYGAGAGVIAGAAIGIATSSRAMIEVTDKKVALNIPEVTAEIAGKDRLTGRTDVAGKMNIFQYRF